ncbi:hypothetical protein AWB80_04415 [Caballeronia pedi]|uniref:DUF4123 domain-containing protein n=1 Tax=Caballeronia pedi TaxID=1777141 RepID=A0A158C0Z1_9BURK|nr:DUF4123 domain-containing protein [Caballeronia pedi]SAK76019.1 hypothetical protein AWB80_04415 [Caballeronia pedi]
MNDTTYLNAETLASSQLTSVLKADQGNIILLLATEALEDWAYPGLAPDAAQFPDAPGVMDLVKAIEPFPVSRWMWSDTQFDVRRQRGPLLVQVGNGSALLETFVKQWAPANGGMVLFTDLDIEGLHRFLTTRVVAGLPQGGEATLRWEPQRWAAVMRALTHHRGSEFLGPITRLVWIENSGPRSYWRQTFNPTPASREAASSAPFSWQDGELRRLGELDKQHFLDALTNELVELPACAGRDHAWIYEQARQAIQYFGNVGIHNEAIVCALLRLSIEQGRTLNTHEARAIVADTTRSPESRLDALRALANN